MTANDLLGYTNCMRQGEEFAKRCGATIAIALKAFEELNKKKNEAIEAQKKKEEERLAAEKVKADEMRANLEREADFQKKLTLAKRKQEECAKFAAEADRLVNSLLRQKDIEDAAAKKAFREAGLKMKMTTMEEQKKKREKCSIMAANGSLKLSLDVKR